MAQNSRPLSPHLQIYKPQITSILSILHRFTGVTLTLAIPVFVFWIFAVSVGSQFYNESMICLSSWWAILFFIGWSFSFYFHFCNGIRHLFWDAGYGFELETISISGWTVVLSSMFLTVITWAYAFYVGVF
jgi:succinate dehydrogenase / fumarate reductase cytochrome b subunit